MKITEFPISWTEDLSTVDTLKVNFVEKNNYKELLYTNPLPFFPLTLEANTDKNGADDEKAFLGFSY